MPDGGDDKEGDFDKLVRRLIAGQATAGYIQKLIAGLINRGVHLLPQNVQMQILRKISVNPGLRAVSAQFPTSWQQPLSQIGGGALAHGLPLIGAGGLLLGGSTPPVPPRTPEQEDVISRTTIDPTVPAPGPLATTKTWEKYLEQAQQVAPAYNPSYDVPLPPQALFAGARSRVTGRPFQVPQQSRQPQSIWANIGSQILPLVKKKVTTKSTRSAGRIHRR